MNEKVSYLLRSLGHITQEKKCPNCGGKEFTLTDSKYLVTRLYKCNACKLNFRFPVDTKKFLEKYYQHSYHAGYSEYTTSITDLPTQNALRTMMDKNFPDKRDHSPFLKALLRSPSAKVIDYGCSWGYGVYQLRNAGFDASGFEISVPRADYGKRLGVTITSDVSAIPPNNDLIMSNHAVEHLPVISEFVTLARTKLTPNGLFVAFCPNGSPEYRKREPDIFHVNWGFLHPNYLDVEFAAHTFRDHPYLILTGDWNYNLDELAAWDGESQKIGDDRSGKELLIIAKPNRK